MKSHPGGLEHTLRMIDMAGLQEGARVLDMGAGAGESLLLMRKRGLDASGIDLEPRSDLVMRGDMMKTGFADGEFDAVFSQCSFYVSGNVPGALEEARRILKPDGIIVMSDVFFADPELLLAAAGFRITYAEDMTAQWRDYYLEALWSSEEDCPVPAGKCSYWLIMGGKE